MPLVQSELTAQSLSFAHAGQVPPPQSTSVSAPFLSTSMQLGVEQTRDGLQLALTQSPSTAHAWPLMQSGQLGPPQSTPVSVPFLKVSVQIGVAQRSVVGLQNPLAQS